MKNKRHNWPQILKHFDKSKLSVPKYAKNIRLQKVACMQNLKNDQNQVLKYQN